MVDAHFGAYGARQALALHKIVPQAFLRFLRLFSWHPVISPVRELVRALPLRANIGATCRHQAHRLPKEKRPIYFP
jgi:hypothetical protein